MNKILVLGLMILLISVLAISNVSSQKTVNKMLEKQNHECMNAEMYCIDDCNNAERSCRFSCDIMYQDQGSAAINGCKEGCGITYDGCNAGCSNGNFVCIWYWDLY